jgi:4-hydroxy-tetrahydrodipicolinate synthase
VPPVLEPGVYVPLVTPFDSSGVVDADALERLAVQLLSRGATGLVATATTAEASSLDHSERELVISVCSRVCEDRDAPLIVGAGTNDTRTTLARHEALANVKAVRASLLVVPYYVRPSEPAVVEHVRLVASRSPVPVVVYNIPYRTGRGLGADALLELAATEGVVGLKQAVGGLDTDTLAVLAGCPDDFSLFCGDDSFIFPTVVMGGSGAIAASAHLCTERFSTLVARALEGRLEEGRRLAAALLPLTTALFSEPSPAILKALLYEAGSIASPEVRMPLASASRPAVERARRALERAEATG